MRSVSHGHMRNLVKGGATREKGHKRERMHNNVTIRHGTFCIWAGIGPNMVRVENKYQGTYGKSLNSSNNTRKA